MTVDQDTELNRASRSVQLPLFCNKHPCRSSGVAAEVLRGVPVEMRGLFDQVEVLTRILLVVPVSSCEAERSFSALRRLNCWLQLLTHKGWIWVRVALVWLACLSWLVIPLLFSTLYPHVYHSYCGYCGYWPQRIDLWTWTLYLIFKMYKSLFSFF